MTAPMTRLAAALLVATAIATVPTDARACWDGFAVTTERVTLLVPTAVTWSPEHARHWATWAARIEALIPADQTLDVTFGDLQICDVATDACTTVERTWDDDDGFTLFELVADAVAADRKTIARARRTDAAPLTVQVAASRDLGAAHQLAARINAAELELGGFLDVGGFPAMNAYAHVVESSGSDHDTYHVVVGAFLDRSDADAARDALAAELSLHGFVRTLAQSSISEQGC